MNNLQLNLKLASNRLYQYFWRSPYLLVSRIETKLKSSIGWKPRFMAPPRTAAVTWIRESEDFHTRIYVWNYWTDHYGIDVVPVKVEIRNAQGEQVGESEFQLNPRQTKVVEIKDILKEIGIKTPFLGTAIFYRMVKGPGFGVPFKLLHEFYGDNFASPVHEYGTIDNFLYKEFQLGVTMTANEDIEDVEIGLASCFFAPLNKEKKVSFRLFNAEGKTVDFQSPSMGAGHVKLLSLNKLYPDWKKFLGNKPGNIGVKAETSIGRTLVFHKHKKRHSYCLNHLTGDKSRPASVIPKHLLDKVGSGPIWAAGVLLDKELKTLVSIIMNWGFGVPYPVEVQIYDELGEIQAQFKHTVKPWETWVFDVADYLAVDSLKKPWQGSVRIHSVQPNFAPTSFDANVEYVGKDWRQGVNVGSSISNLGSDASVKSYQVSRTKNFIRVRCDKAYDTYLSIVNHSSSPTYNTPSQTTLRLISEDGKTELKKNISIPPKGAFYQSVEEMFPEAKKMLGANGVGALHVRDTTVKLAGVHILKNRKTGVLSGDHYFGG